MKAWRISEHGDLTHLKQVEVPSPAPGPMEALVQVKTVGLNHLDLWVLRGVADHHFPLPLIPGCDVCGTLEALGPGSEEALAKRQLGLGSEVILNPGTSCGGCEPCLNGLDPLCRSYGILGETQDGGCAEKIVVPVANIIQKPGNLSAIECAALPIPYLTAWTMLVRKAQLRAGEIILIQAGGSGVSVAAIQIAKLLGATVITTVGSTGELTGKLNDKVKKAQALGADHVIEYSQTPFREEVQRYLKSLGKKGCDVVLDHIGADTFQESLKCLTWGGRFVTCGATSGGEVSLDLKALFFKNLSLLGSTMGSKGDLIRVIELAQKKKLQPVIDTVLPLSRLPEAFERLTQRKVFGKVVLTSDEINL